MFQHFSNRLIINHSDHIMYQCWPIKSKIKFFGKSTEANKTEAQHCSTQIQQTENSLQINQKTCEV